MVKNISVKKDENKKTALKGNFGSVDYTNFNKLNNLSQLSQYTSNQMLIKKSSQQAFVKELSPPKELKDQKYKKVLKKNMSEEKNIKLNLDVNVNINLKFNKKL